MTTALVYDAASRLHKTGPHPENSKRFDVILEALENDQALWQRLARLAPREASDAEIACCHSERLIEQIRKLCERGVPYIDLDTVISEQSFEVARLAAGAVLVGIDQVFGGGAQNAFALVRPPGHHATPSRAMGFCLFNNAAIGARYAQTAYGVERVLIIDWDVHHGNGTQDIFYSDPTVYYFSTHQYPYYPGTGAATERGEGRGQDTTLNVPLGEGTSARDHRQAFSDALRAIEARFPPDLILISAGFDSRRGDPLGGLLLEDADFREMTKEVMGMAERHGHSRVVSVLEGGYNLDTLGETVRTHVAALSA
ncbi:MAG: histone deacetylase [Blastocatellia bacterium]